LLSFQTKESVSQNEEVRDQVDEQIEAFKDNSRKFTDPVQDEVNHKGTMKSKFAEKLERYEHFKEAIEEAKKEIHIENVVDTEKVIDLENSENDLEKSEKSVEEVIKENLDDIKGLDQLEAVVDKRREVMELEKEHRIESKIAEILDEIKDPDDVKQTEKVDDKSIRQEFINNRKPPAMPAVDKAFIAKANKIVEKMASENKIAMIKVQQEDHGTPEIVTAARRDQFEAVKQLVYSIQKFYPKEKIYIFDLDLTDQQRRHVSLMHCTGEFVRTKFRIYSDKNLKIRSHKSKDSGQKKKNIWTHNDLQNTTQKTATDRTTRTPLKTGG
jgi:hypothetical protein